MFTRSQQFQSRVPRVYTVTVVSEDSSQCLHGHGSFRAELPVFTLSGQFRKIVPRVHTVTAVSEDSYSCLHGQGSFGD